jgi:hypothetical protein
MLLPEETTMAEATYIYAKGHCLLAEKVPGVDSLLGRRTTLGRLIERTVGPWNPITFVASMP